MTASEAQIDAALRDAAQTVVREEPLIEAVLLYGSRARRTHGEESDWDVVLMCDVTDVTAPEAWPLRNVLSSHRWPEMGAEVNTVVLSRPQHVTRAHQVGTLDNAVAMDARLLAGQWTRPILKEEHMTPSEAAIQQFLEQAAQEIENACTSRAKMAAGVTVKAADLQYQTQFTHAAEFWAKACTITLGIRMEKGHKLNELGDVLLRHGRKGEAAWYWGQIVKSLNGSSGPRHLARYPETSLVGLSPGDVQCVLTIDAMDEWLAHASLVHTAPVADQAGRKRILEDVKTQVRSVVEEVGHHRHFSRLPAPIREAMERLDTICTHACGSPEQRARQALTEHGIKIGRRLSGWDDALASHGQATRRARAPEAA